MTEAKAPATIKVRVGFPLAERPYHGEFTLDTTVGTVRARAMAEFGASEDARFVYYLTHKDDRQADETTIGNLVGKARALKFTLVKQITQGWARPVVDAETKLNLEADEAAVGNFLEKHGGRLERDPGEPGIYWATLRPKNTTEEEYYARVAWSCYPHAPPSVKFADHVCGSLNVTSAWPVAPGFRPTSFDICKPLTAEGFALHPEWHTGPDAWPTTGNPFLWVVQTLQHDLDTGYEGRSA